jgi:hypothetical protein
MGGGNGSGLDSNGKNRLRWQAVVNAAKNFRFCKRENLLAIW